MAELCPNISDPDFHKLYVNLGGDDGDSVANKNAMNSAYRMWRSHDDMNPGEGTRYALDAFNRTSVDKLNDIQKWVKNISPPKEGGEHIYTWNGDPSIQLTSLSQALDDASYTPHVKTASEQIFSESGTRIHKLFKQIVDYGDPENENIKKYANDNQIPDTLVNQLFALKEDLDRMGTVVSEQMVYTEDAMADVRIVGTADIIVYGDDGRKYIVDLKTVYSTEAKRRAGEAPWNPQAYNGQKAKRYTAQTLGYGRMTEWADGQAATDHFIVPIQVELNDEKDLSKGYKSATRVIGEDGKPVMTSVNEWGEIDYATRMLDKIFGVSSIPPSTKPLIGRDDSSKIYENLTGDQYGSEKSAEDTARKVSRGIRPSDKAFGYYDDRGKFYKFNNQLNPEAQLQQIVNDYVNRRGRYNADLSSGVKNFVESGDEKYLKSIGDHKKTLSKLFKPFIGRKDINIYNLDELKGYEDKKNWLLIEEGKTRHLYYVSSDNMKRRFTTNRTLGVSSVTSLFGRAIDSLTAKRINSSLENTIGDARAFEGTLIAIQLKKANPEVNFGMTMIHGLTGSGYSDMIDLKENLETIQALKDDPLTRDSDKIFSPLLMDLINEPGALDYDGYRTDFAELLGSYMDSRLEAGDVSADWVKIVNRIKSTADNEADRKELMEKISDYLNKHIRMGKKVETDYETYLLSAFYLQMQDMDVSLLPVSMWRQWLGMAQNISNPILQQVNAKLNNAVNTLSSAFHNEYKDEFTKVQAEYFKSLGFASASEAMISPSQGYRYEQLFQKVTKKMRGAPGQADVDAEIPSFTLKKEGTAEFNVLTPQAQKMITTINKIIAHFTKASESGHPDHIPWIEGNLPLVRADVANKLYNQRRDVGIAQGYKNVLNDWLTDLDSNFGVGDDTDPISDNIFHSQRQDTVGDPRLEMMGFQSDDYVDTDKYHKWSTDLEAMMDIFAIQALKHRTLNEVGATMSAVNSIFRWHASGLMEDRLGAATDWINDMKTINIDNRDLDAGTVQNRIARLVARGASITMYGFNPITAAGAYLGNELTVLSESIANSISGSGRFSFAASQKAKALFGGVLAKGAYDKLSASDVNALDKVSLLMRKFRMFNEDISSFLNGYHKTGDKFLLRSKYLFGMLNAGDYASRAEIMIAQMIDDGTWDAFTVSEDKELVYDEAKDDRFNGRGKLTPDQRVALRKKLAEDVGYTPSGNLAFGYDESMGNSMRAMSNYLLGSNDREARATANYIWWGKLLLGSKGWLSAKMDRWLLGLGKGKNIESKTIGEYAFDVDADGNTQAFWNGDQLEGILVSWLALADNLKRKKSQRVPLTTLQKNNITRSISDLALLMMASALAAGLIDKDKKTKQDDIAARILMNGSNDLLVLFTAMQKPEFLWNPISLMWASKTVNKGFSAVYNMDMNKLVSISPIAAQMNSFSRMMDDTDVLEFTEKVNE